MIIKPLKKFGQNYLNDPNIITKLIDVLSINYDDSVLEIGPGKGSITAQIVPLVKNFYAIEIDTRVIDDLSIKFKNLNLINTDVKKIKFKDLEIVPPIKIIGNIPFNLTGDILFKLIEEKEIIGDVSFIVSLDIAKRLTAKKQTKEYGALTVIFDYLTSTQLVSKVSKNVFYPKPNIDAAIIHIKFDKIENQNIDRNIFIKVVKASFGNRRKTLINSLRNSIFGNCDFSSIDFQFNKRAEELEVKDFLILTEFLQNQKCQ
jgi:16S rRNA (adenine1518-N6/adenine1519-N6)-dimethyltransferase